MAEENVIEKRLRVYFEAQGVRDVEKALKDIKGSTGNIYDEINKVEAEYGNLDDAVKKVVKSYDKSNKISIRGMKAQGAAIRGLSTDFDNFSKTVKMSSSALKKLVIPVSFQQSTGIVDNYNKLLLTSASRLTRFGVGIKEAEGRFISLGKNLSYTRKETLNLFKTYERGFKFVSLGNFEKTLDKVTKAVGSNSEAAGELMGTLGLLSQKYIGLVRDITSVNEAENERAASQAKGLLLAQKITDTEYRGVQAVLNARRQLSPQDKLREQTVQNQIKAMQDLRKVGEEVGIAMGEAILPVIEDISKWIKNLNVDFGTLAKMALQAGVAIAAIKVGGVINQGVRGVNQVLAAKSFGAPGTPLDKVASAGQTMKGLRGRGGKQGAMGGLGSLIGSASFIQKVHVVNWPPAMGGRSMGYQNADRAERQIRREQLQINRMRKDSGVAGFSKTRTLGGMISKGAMSSIRSIKSPGAMIAGFLGSQGLGYLQEKQAAAGNIRTAGAAGAGSSLMGMLGGASSGAMIGSIVGPIGTAVGGAVGAAMSLWSSKSNLFEDIKEMITGKKAGPTAEEKKIAKRDAQIEAEVRDEVKGKRKPETVESIVEQSVTLTGEELLVRLRDAKKDVESLSKEADAAQTDFNSLLDSIVQIPGGIDGTVAGLKKLEGAIADEQKVLEGLKSSGSSDQAIEDQQKLIKGKEEERDQIQEAQAAAVRNNSSLSKQQDILKDRNSLLDAAKNRTEGYTELLGKQKDILASINTLYNSQVAVLDATIGRMRVTGQIDAGALIGQIDDTLAGLDEEIKMRQSINEMFQEFVHNGKQVDIDKAKSLGATKATVEVMKKMNAGTIKEAEMQAQMNENVARITDREKERLAITSKIGEAYEGQLGLTQAQATQMDKMVSLADNFAIGVGASAQLRLRAFQAEQKNIDVLTEKYDAMAMAMQNGTIDTVEGKKQLVELENQILDSQIKQAGQVKSLRDGWISAIGAMNTGAGTFSKIIIDQEQAVGQSLRMGGVVSSKSGAFSSFGEDGRMMEEAGYRESSRFSATPGGGMYLPGQSGGQGNFAYNTGTGIDRYLDEGMRKGLSRMVKDKTGGAGRGSEDTSSFTSLALAGNQHVMGQFMAQASATGNPYENPRGTGVPDRKDDQREGRGFSKTGQGMFSGRDMDMGNSSKGTSFQTDLSVAGSGGRFDAPEAAPPAAVVDKMLGVLVGRGEVDKDVLRKRTLAEQAAAVESGEGIGGQLTGENDARRKERALIEATKDMSDKEMQSLYKDAGMTTGPDKKELESIRGAGFGDASTDPNVKKDAERVAPTTAEADMTVELMRVGKLIVDNFVGGAGGKGGTGEAGGGSRATGGAVVGGTREAVDVTPGEQKDSLNKEIDQKKELNKLEKDSKQTAKEINDLSKDSSVIGSPASKELKEKAKGLMTEASLLAGINDNNRNLANSEKERTAAIAAAVNVESKRAEIDEQKSKTTTGGTMATSPPMSVAPLPLPVMPTEALSIFESQKDMLQEHINELQKKDSKISSSMAKNQEHLAGIRDAQDKLMKAVAQNQKRQSLIKGFS